MSFDKAFKTITWMAFFVSIIEVTLGFFDRGILHSANLSEWAKMGLTVCYVWCILGPIIELMRIKR